MRVTVSDEMRAVLSAALDQPIPDDVAGRLHLPSTDPASYRPGGENHPGTPPVSLAEVVSLDQAPRTVTISLRIEATYELHDEVVTTVTDKVIPAPPAPPDSAGYDEAAWNMWAYTNVYQLTGTGQTDGDSWYDVEVTACSDDRLIGLTFQWGY